ncbi:hypothetical protein Nmel_018476, partial [Mimus melanotis]
MSPAGRSCTRQVSPTAPCQSHLHPVLLFSGKGQVGAEDPPDGSKEIKTKTDSALSLSCAWHRPLQLHPTTA